MADEDITRTMRSGSQVGGNAATTTAGEKYVRDFLATNRAQRHDKQRRSIGTVEAKINILHNDESKMKKEAKLRKG